MKKRFFFLLWLLPVLVRGQAPARPTLEGRFLTDSIDIGRPFQYALTYRHAAVSDVLFPDTSRHFAPYIVQKVAVFPTQTTGSGPGVISRDSAVYTLLSFETNPAQRLRIPVRVIHETDCTELWTSVDTVFLRSNLGGTRLASGQRQAMTLITETNLAPLPQQFNYLLLVVGIVVLCLVALTLYGLLGSFIRRQQQLVLLNRRHRRFMREFAQLTRRINAYTATETANQALILWKSYLERLDKQPYTSLTTAELATRLHDERISNALRDVDQMIYGGSFSAESLPALQRLSEVATTIYHRRSVDVKIAGQTVLAQPTESAPIVQE